MLHFRSCKQPTAASNQQSAPRSRRGHSRSGSRSHSSSQSLGTVGEEGTLVETGEGTIDVGLLMILRTWHLSEPGFLKRAVEQAMQRLEQAGKLDTLLPGGRQCQTCKSLLYDDWMEAYCWICGSDIHPQRRPRAQQLLLLDMICTVCFLVYPIRVHVSWMLPVTTTLSFVIITLLSGGGPEGTQYDFWNSVIIFCLSMGAWIGRCFVERFHRDLWLKSDC